MGPFKKYVTCIMAFFTPFNFVKLCQFYCTTSPVSFTKLPQETIEWEGKIFFPYMAASAYHVISTKVENHIFKHDWIFRHVFLNNPLWQSSGILIFLCKYYIVVSDTLIGSSLDVLFLLLDVILSELIEKPRRKDWVTEKSTERNLCVGYHFFDCTLSFPCLFVAFFVYSLPLPKWRTCGMAARHIYCYGWYPVW